MIGCIRFFAMVLFICVFPLTTRGSVMIEIFPSIAPNKNSAGTGWNVYASNAIDSLLSGTSNVGNRQTDIGAYEILANPITAKEIVATNGAPTFHSWQGEADPFAPFANEHGNRLHFGIRIFGTDGQKLTASGISYSIRSADQPPVLLSASGSLAGSFSDSKVGILYGPDGIFGGGDDVLITSGTGPAEGVDALVYVGISVALQPPTTGTSAERLAEIIQTTNSETLFDIKATYTFSGQSASAIVSVVPIPEPSAIAVILATCTFGLFGGKRN